MFNATCMFLFWLWRRKKKAVCEGWQISALVPLTGTSHWRVGHHLPGTRVTRRLPRTAFPHPCLAWCGCSRASLCLPAPPLYMHDNNNTHTHTPMNWQCVSLLNSREKPSKQALRHSQIFTSLKETNGQMLLRERTRVHTQQDRQRHTHA